MPAETELFLARLHAQQVGGPVEKVRVKAGRGDEPVDELGPFVRGWVVKELAGLLFRWNAPDDAKIGAAEKRGVVHQRARLETRPLKIITDQPVDPRGGLFHGGIRKRLRQRRGTKSDHEKNEEGGSFHECAI